MVMVTVELLRYSVHDCCKVSVQPRRKRIDSPAAAE
jgi:hypothetical protein